MTMRSGCLVTPLVAALSRRHFQTAELLHHNGADVNVCCYEGKTPLHSASWFGDFEMVQVLLNFRADVNVCSDEGWTPIHYVSQGFQHSVIPNVYQSLPDVARLLLGHGADVNVRCYGGETPLHSASWCGDFKMIQVLLNFRADVNVWSDEGWTPIHYVSQGFQNSVIPNVYQSLPDVARLLLEHGRKRADL